VRVKYPEGAKGKPEEEVFLTSWAPGNMTPECPPGTGKFLPRGARFNFELHYNTTGKPETDSSELGLYLAKEAPKAPLPISIQCGCSPATTSTGRFRASPRPAAARW